jgi:hypothetical protein
VRFYGKTVPLLLTLGVAIGARGVSADDIYKWTDEQGRVHYSNRGGSSAPEDVPPEPSGEEGWESALERKRGTDEFNAAADSAINSLQARMIRTKRERGRAQQALESIQAEIVRAQGVDPNSVPELRAREVTQLGEIRKIDAEIAAVELQVAKLRAAKAVGREQAEKAAPVPFPNP